MRRFELVLCSAMVAAFALIVVPAARATMWTGFAVAVLMVAALGQVVFEGRRWQMVPAYTWVVAFSSTSWLAVGTGSGSHLARAVAVGLPVVGGTALLLSVVLPLALPVFRLPEPAGPFAIGTLTYHWVDANRSELFSAEPSAPRALMAQVWYPASPVSSVRYAPYLQDAAALTPALARAVRLPAFVFAHLRYVRTHAVPAAEVAHEPARYPVLVFLSGRSGFRASNTAQVESLVSHGYVVVGLDLPGAAAAVRFPDGRLVQGLANEVLQPLVRQSMKPLPVTPVLSDRAMPEGIVPYLAADVRTALDRLEELDAGDPLGVLTGRLDLHRVGVFGVSLGGSVAAQACLLDARLRACLAMDASMPAEVAAAGLRQPVMFLTRDEETMRLERTRVGGWPEEAIALTVGSMRAAFEASLGEGYYVRIPGVFHLGFTDVPRWVPLASRLGLLGSADAKRAFEHIDAYTLAHFDRSLRGRSEPLLDRPVALRHGVVVEARSPGA